MAGSKSRRIGRCKPRTSFTTFIIAFLMLSGAAPPKPLVELAPSGPWNLHYENESCKLRRSFGEGDGRVSIEMTRFGPGDSFQLILYGKPIKSLINRGKYKVAFGAFSPHDSKYATKAFDGNHIDVTILGLPGLAPRANPIRPEQLNKNIPFRSSITPAQEAAVTKLAITSQGQGNFLLNTGSLGPPFASWRTCISDLVRSWGVDPTAQFSSMATPLTSPATWLSSFDYPTSALRENKEGLVYFRLSIDPNGKITQCSVQRAINQSEFARITCDLISKRGRFTPARDLAGTPVPGFFISSVRFNIPG